METDEEKQEFLDELSLEFGDFYQIPEGGTNTLAIKGCEEILTPADNLYDFICVSVGTGGTLAGMSLTTQAHQKLIGFSSLKGDFMNAEVAKWTVQSNWQLNTDYAFGGYGKITAPLITFINQFQFKKIKLDPSFLTVMQTK